VYSLSCISLVSYCLSLFFGRPETAKTHHRSHGGVNVTKGFLGRVGLLVIFVLFLLLGKFLLLPLSLLLFLLGLFDSCLEICTRRLIKKKYFFFLFALAGTQYRRSLRLFSCA